MDHKYYGLDQTFHSDKRQIPHKDTNQIANKKLVSDLVESFIEKRFALWNWLFMNRRYIYKERIYYGVKRDEKRNVIRDFEDKVEFLEDPRSGTQFLGLMDKDLFQRYLFDKMEGTSRNFLSNLSTLIPHQKMDRYIGKDVFKEKLIDEVYSLTTEAIEYAKDKIFYELEIDAKHLRIKAQEYAGEEDFELIMPKTEAYFGRGMKDKLDPSYEDKLAFAKLGKQRIDEWKEDVWDINRAYIQIEYYCKEWIEKKGEDKFVIFDHTVDSSFRNRKSDEIWKDFSFREFLYVPNINELFEKYEIIVWGKPTPELRNNNLNRYQSYTKTTFPTAFSWNCVKIIALKKDLNIIQAKSIPIIP